MDEHSAGLSPHAQRVAKFMRLAGQDLPDFPQGLSTNVRMLRARLILEEALETIRGLGIEVLISSDSTSAAVDLCSPDIECLFVPNDRFDLVETVDGCLDVIVVTTGCLLAMGCRDAALQQLVDENNLAKFGPGGYRHPETGKWIKPPDHRPPDIRGELARQAGL